MSILYSLYFIKLFYVLYFHLQGSMENVYTNILASIQKATGSFVMLTFNQ